MATAVPIAMSTNAHAKPSIVVTPSADRIGEEQPSFPSSQCRRIAAEYHKNAHGMADVGRGDARLRCFSLHAYAAIGRSDALWAVPIPTSAPFVLPSKPGVHRRSSPHRHDQKSDRTASASASETPTGLNGRTAVSNRSTTGVARVPQLRPLRPRSAHNRSTMGCFAQRTARRGRTDVREDRRYRHRTPVRRECPVAERPRRSRPNRVRSPV
jgi:hypothetical protein